MLSSANKSEIAVLKVELRANEKGYNVSLPKNQASAYDLILDCNNKLYKAQVKYLNRKSSGSEDVLCLLINKNSSNGKYIKKRKYYTDKEIDILLCYCPKIDKVLYFTPEQFHNKEHICVHLKNPKVPTYYKNFLW